MRLFVPRLWPVRQGARDQCQVLQFRRMLDWLWRNRQWAFSGIGVFVLGGVVWIVRWMLSKASATKVQTRRLEARVIELQGLMREARSALIGAEEENRRLKHALENQDDVSALVDDIKAAIS